MLKQQLLMTIVHLYVSLCKRTVLYRTIRSYFNRSMTLVKQTLTTIRSIYQNMPKNFER